MNATRICFVEGCGGKTKAHGLCNRHYIRLRTHGEVGEAEPRVVRSSSGICSFPGCGRKHHANTFCFSHWRQVRRGEKATTLAARPMFGLSLEARMSANTEKFSGCWEWRGQTERGYGTLRVEDKKQYAHRIAYEQCFGPIPEGLEIDHKCRNSLCVRPSHLHAVTKFENAQNKSLQSNNKTGYRGVYQNVKRNGQVEFVVEVGAFGVRHRGGRYDTAEEANLAAIALRNKVQTNNRKDWE